MVKYYITRAGKTKKYLGLTVSSDVKKKILRFLKRYQAIGRTRKQIISAVSILPEFDISVAKGLRALVSDGYVTRK